ncbi:Adaptin N terminal region family protein [Histomonas meleagridis]|uniref:Adaptin N terminal region family protein n=1 Tax=Histomonas meleagridis TaxID=135588 RepID=UPI00355A125A|nr:Adaptin N terminal region family protein [Histomonas meleagridis]KAH0804934.1 Adaptin N terminal region family protein [Histomonas meleagridis]
MTQSFEDFVSILRLAESKQKEKSIISKEQAQIRNYLRNVKDYSYMPTVVSKLIYLDMVGCNVSYGQMDIINLMANERFSYKRVGYIAASALLDQTNEVTVLVTQNLLKDIESTDLNVQCLALTFIANLGSPEVCRSVAPNVSRLLKSTDMRILKRAGMATVSIIRQNPDIANSYKNSVQGLLNSNNHGAVTAGINLVITMLQIEPRLRKSWASYTSSFGKILKSLVNSGPVMEFAKSGFNDPMMQVKTLKVISLIGAKNNSELENILQTIISSCSTRKNTGRSILFQTVETIFAISKKPSLRGIALNQVGRLLSSKKPNVVYSALSLMARILGSKHVLIKKGNADSMAIQRYKDEITKCLNHKDASIRRRALDVISSLINKDNADKLIPEILIYIKFPDADFRRELVTKIYYSIQEFATDPKWIFETVHQILVENGNYCSSEIISSFCEFIMKSPEIYTFAIHHFSSSLMNYCDNQSLLQVSSFVIGEFSMEDDGSFESLSQILNMPQTTFETKMYIIIAIAKMSTRFNKKEYAYNLFSELVKSNNLEIQQRSGEMMKLLTHTDVCEEMLAPIADATNVEMQATTENSNNKTQVDDILMSIINDSTPQQQQQSNNSINLIDDLIGDLQPKKNEPTIVAKTSDFVICGQSKVNPQNQNQIAIQLVVYAVNNAQLDNFRTDFQVPNGWRINAQPASADTVTRSEPVTQVVYLMNESGGKFEMRVRCRYRRETNEVEEVLSVSELPNLQ